MTDARLIERAHALLLSCLKQEIDADACVVELTGLFEENGHPFIFAAVHGRAPTDPDDAANEG